MGGAAALLLLLLTGTLGAALAATESLATSDVPASIATEKHEETTKAPLKRRKQFLDKLGFGLEPYDSRALPFPLDLPMSWSPPPPTEMSKTADNETPDETENLIVWKEETADAGFPDFVANVSPDILVKSATRMMTEEAQRRKKFKKAMQSLVHAQRLPETNDQIDFGTGVMATVDRSAELGKKFDDVIMRDVSRSLNRISRIMPFVRSMFSSLVSPFAPFIHSSGTQRDNVKSRKGNIKYTEIADPWRLFASQGEIRNQPGADRNLHFPRDSVTIDVAVLPLQIRLIPDQSKDLNMPTGNIRSLEGSFDDDDVSALRIPDRSFSPFGRFLALLRNDELIPPNDVTNSTQSSVINSQPTDRITLLGKRIDDTEPTTTVINFAAPEVNHDNTTEISEETSRNKEEIRSNAPTLVRTKRQADLPVTEAKEDLKNTAESPQNRMMENEEAAAKAETSRMLVPPGGAVGTAAVSMPRVVGSNLHFHPHMVPRIAMMNMLLPNNFRFHQMKPFFKVLPFFMGNNPMMYEKMAHHLKMFPKFPMTGVVGAPMTAMEQELIAMNHLANAEAAAQTSAAASATAASTAAPLAASAAHLGATVAPCLAAMCGMHLLGRRSARPKRSIRGDGGSAFQQAIHPPGYPFSRDERDWRSSSFAAGGPSYFGAAGQLDIAAAKAFKPVYAQPRPIPQKIETGRFDTHITGLDIGDPALQKPSDGKFSETFFPFPQSLRSGGKEPVDENEMESISDNGETLRTSFNVPRESALELKDLFKGSMIGKRKTKKASATTSGSEQISWDEPWGAPSHGMSPLLRRIPRSLPAEKESRAGDERALSRGRHALVGDSVRQAADADLQVPAARVGNDAVKGSRASSGGTHQRAVGGSRHNGRRRLKTRPRGTDESKTSQPKDKTTEDQNEYAQYKSINPNPVPFLDPSMMSGGHDDHFHRREMPNDFQISGR